MIYENEKSEINLYEIYLVIKKRIMLILMILAASVLLAVIVNYLETPIYRVSASIVPGWLDLTEEGKIVYVDSPQNIASTIENGGFRLRIIEELNLGQKNHVDQLQFETHQPRGSKIINIKFLTSDHKEGEKIVNELLKQIQAFYGKRVNTKQQKISSAIEIIKNQVAKIKNEKTVVKNKKITIASQKARFENDKRRLENAKTKINNDREKILDEKEKIQSHIGLEKKKIVLLEDSEKSLNKQFEEVQANTKSIIAEKRRLLKGNTQADSIALLLYSNTIQQNISYIDRLNAQINTNKLNQESEKNNIKNLEIELKGKNTDLNNLGLQLKNKDLDLKNIDLNLKDLDTKLNNLEASLKNLDIEIMNTQQEIENLSLDRELIEGVHILQPAFSSSKPIKPKKLMNIGVAVILSLSFGVFLVFFLEFLERNKS